MLGLTGTSSLSRTPVGSPMWSCQVPHRRVREGEAPGAEGCRPDTAVADMVRDERSVHLRVRRRTRDNVRPRRAGRAVRSGARTFAGR